MHKHKQAGFTLIEMVIVIIVIAILASIALPNYQEYVRRGYRAEGQAYLNDAAAREERWYAQNPTSGYTTTASNLSIPSGTSSLTGKYTLGIATGAAADGGYVLTATATFTDAKCLTLTLNAAGIRGNTGTGSVNDCWR